MVDANQTRQHALIGKDDFSLALAQPDFAWDETYNELTLAPLVFRFPTSPFNRRPRIEDRRGAIADQYGNIYWIADSEREILVKNSGGGPSLHFWSADDVRSAPRDCEGGFTPLVPIVPPSRTLFAGLAVTCAHFLVAGAPELNGLFVFDLHHGGAPRFVAAPSGTTLAPWDIAASPDGGAWILDREHFVLWALDRNFDFLPLDPGVVAPPPASPDFRPLNAAAPVQQPPRPASPLALITDGGPMAVLSVEVLPDGTVLVLETDTTRPASRIFTVRGGRLSSAGTALTGIESLIEEDRRADFRMHAHDIAIAITTDTSGAWSARLFAAAPEGDQSFAFGVSFDQGGQLLLDPVREYFPMRLFGGKAIFGAAGTVLYDSRDEWVSLTRLRILRYATHAVFETQVFDGRTPECTWHRLILDAIVPPGARIAIRSRASNSKVGLAAQSYRNEPVPYRRRAGAEIPYYEPFPSITGSGCTSGAGSWELLLQQARGRYLQFEFTLTGDARVSPRIRAARIYYPRFSYLEKYMPRVYREDAGSASFLERFLANPEGIFTTIEDRIAAAQVLFDSDTAPGDALEYLASWLGVALEPAWDERKRRLFLRNASRFFVMRGTRGGMLAALRMALEDNPSDDVFLQPECGESQGVRIVEHFTSRLAARVAVSSTAAASASPAVLRAEQWTPSQGAAELHRRYAEATGQSGAEFPVARPADSAAAEAWETFARRTLGFVPSAYLADTPSWQAFLRRRYRTLDALRTAWLATPESFENVPIPAAIPVNLRQLSDWFDFQSVVLPVRAKAHRFTVFLPVGEEEAFRQPVQEARRELARRIVALQKPAHTTFDVQFYWTFFRIGDVRLGVDAVLDLGSRSPNLMIPALLGNSFIASSYLAANYPENLQHRRVLGRGNCADRQDKP